LCVETKGDEEKKKVFVQLSSGVFDPSPHNHSLPPPTRKGIGRGNKRKETNKEKSSQATPIRPISFLFQEIANTSFPRSITVI